MNAFIYTCIVCRRDVLPPPRIVPPGFILTCFTDEPFHIDNDGWPIVDLVCRHESPTLTARWHKILPHVHSPSHDYYIWVDGHIIPKVDLTQLLEFMGSTDIAAFRHRLREDPYEEVDAVSVAGLESSQVCDAAVALLKEEGYPRKDGLHETGILIMRNTESLRAMLDDWWAVLKSTGGSRDQFHFDRLTRKHSLNVLDLPGTVRDNEFFDWTEHAHPASDDTIERQRLWTV